VSLYRSLDHRNLRAPWCRLLRELPDVLIVQRYRDRACTQPVGRPVAVQRQAARHALVAV
jgi:hypothetical protein